MSTSAKEGIIGWNSDSGNILRLSAGIIVTGAEFQDAALIKTNAGLLVTDAQLSQAALPSNTLAYFSSHNNSVSALTIANSSSGILSTAGWQLNAMEVPRPCIFMEKTVYHRLEPEVPGNHNKNINLRNQNAKNFILFCF